uniref:Protein N-terminal asparagine amidohydrolase n=1 Tax=Ciona intestinalis TaxID=7719 RepID=H2XRS9_CIOIN
MQSYFMCFLLITSRLFVISCFRLLMFNMPLIINGIEIKDSDRILDDLQLFVQKYKNVYKDCSSRLKSTPVTLVTRCQCCLYVMQGELATVGGADKSIKCVGTDMATTCHIVVIRCRQTATTSLAHFDGSFLVDGAKEMLKSIENIRTPEGAQGYDLDLHIIGGFDDDRKLSGKLSTDLLRTFQTLSSDRGLKLYLRTFCCSPFNTCVVTKHGVEINSPVIFGVVVTVGDGKIYGADFAEDARGPVRAMRAARGVHGRKQMFNVYDYVKERFIVPPFTYQPLPFIEEWIEQSDSFIKENMSTSPDVEPAFFAPDTRESLRFIATHPNPMHSIFKSNLPLFYKLDGGLWKQE